MPESKTILLVEDEALIALHEKLVLEKAGYQVVHARTGEMAVAACFENEAVIDLILMDIDLGHGIDGTQAAQQILARRDIPIIFLSMHTEQEWVDKTEQITSYGYIVKDSGTTVLLASIKMAFKLHNAHARLQESEDRYRMLVENSTNSIGIHCEGKVVYANAAAVRLFNAGRLENLLGWPVLDLVHPDYRDAAAARVKAAYQKQAFASTIEEKFFTLDGKEIDVEVTGIPINYHGKPATQLILRDITHRKQVEQELRESEERLRQIIEQMPYPVEICDPAGTATTVNQAFLNLFGIPTAELVVNRYNVFQDALVMDVLGLSDVIRRVYAGEVVFIPELVVPLAQVSPEYQSDQTNSIVLEASMFPVFRTTGELGSVVTIWKNITERKQAETILEALLLQVTHARDEAARTSEQLDAMMERVSDGIVAFDKDFNYTYVNTYGAQLLGCTKEELLGKNYWTEYPEARGTPFANAYVRAMQTQQPVVFEDYYVHWGRWFINRIYPSNEGITILFNDISDRKQVEETLNEREKEYKTLVENTPDVIARFDRQFRHLYVNPVVEKEWGIAPASLLGKTHRELGQPPEQADWSEGLLRQVFEGGQEVVFELSAPSPTGKKHYLSRGVPEFAEDGSVCSVLIIHRNITARVQVEDALRQSEARVQAMFQAIPDLVFRMDRDGVFLDYKGGPNDLYAQVEGGIVGKPVGELLPPGFSEMVAEKIRATLASGSLQAFEYQLPIPERGLRQYEARMTVSGPDEVTAIVRDITERKQGEDQIKLLLAEKELLLREVHHRIKNNMSTIISLLTLQANSQRDPASKMVLQDASSRVQSMMVLYDKLYQSEDINLVSLRAYVPALLNEVISLFPQHETVTVEAQVADIPMPPQRLSPLGIILTELTTNSMKYAFPDRRQGRITVLAVCQGGEVTLTYQDDGVGLPETFDIKRSPRFGMYLVDMLVDQLHGTIAAERQGGTCFVIRFPV